MELSGLQIFKFLPAAKKAEHTNCKECGFPTCMAFALKLAKGAANVENCKYLPNELMEKIEHSRKQPQNTVEIGDLKIGGENVLYRHEKTFLNKPVLGVVIDFSKPDWREKLKRINDFEISILNEIYKVDLIILRNYKGEKIENQVQCRRNCLASESQNGLPPIEDSLISLRNPHETHSNNFENALTEEEFLKLPLKKIEDGDFEKTAAQLKFIREKAILEKDENFTQPVYVEFKKSDDLEELCAKGAFYICKYANMLVFENFDETLFSTLIMLRGNIFTDPQKPLKVEPKIYEFNNPDENSLIFLTTNFALTFFAVANELESLDQSSYLIVTPADGMSVLTAWSAEKFTAQMVAKTLKKFDLSGKVKNRKIIIPGLLAHMKKELENELSVANLDFEIVVGTIDAFAISDFVKAKLV